MKYKINGKEYNSKRFDFAGLVKFEECGVGIKDLQKVSKPMALIVGLVAWIADLDKDDAIKEVNEHIENGGRLQDILKIMESIKDSDFFQKAMKNED